ncbi:MAG TPA: cation diffusion facilitator family transporter [bacterium]|nr:cation diffusion facilitator family transporter [bacterium]HPN44155.1 cation diffusion facilitator family transporter [bacterium]
MDKIQANKLTQFEGWFSIFFNIILFILKYWAGIVTGSIALVADAWHTLSDSVSSIFVLIGAKVSIKPADKAHPFGHGRAESIASIVIGVLLSMIALNFLQESITKLRNHEMVNFGMIAIVVTIISIVAKEGLAQFALWAWRKNKATLLKADAWHHRSDAISSVIILAGIFLGKHFWWIDGVLGIIVAIMIFYASLEIFRDAVNPLLGEQPDTLLVNQVNEICGRVAATNNFKAHHFHIHKYGDHTELTFHIKLPGSLHLKKAHDIATEIEKAIKSELNIEATIHTEPDNSNVVNQLKG